LNTQKVLHISFSSTGGAGKFAKRLQEHQLLAGLGSAFLSFNEGGLTKSLISHPKLFAAGALDFGLVRADIRKPLFSLLRDYIELLGNEKKIDSKTVIHLHWTPGVVSHDSISELLATHKVVWTLHDMFPITGGCHHSLDCVKYESLCEKCPQVRSIFRSRVENDHKRKIKSSEFFENLTVVSPSLWLAEKAKASSIMSRAKVLHIPNAIDGDIFSPIQISEEEIISSLKNRIVFGLCATDLSDKNKNIDGAILAINAVAKKFPNKIFKLIVIGSNFKKYLVQNNVSISEQGSVGSDSQLADLYQKMDVFINPSFRENFPTTVQEALATGVPCVAWDSGGTSELIHNDENGILVSTIEELEDALSLFCDPKYAMELKLKTRRGAKFISNYASCVEAYNYAYDFR